MPEPSLIRRHLAPPVGQSALEKMEGGERSSQNLAFCQAWAKSCGSFGWLQERCLPGPSCPSSKIPTIFIQHLPLPSPVPFLGPAAAHSVNPLDTQHRRHHGMFLTPVCCPNAPFVPAYAHRKHSRRSAPPRSSRREPQRKKERMLVSPPSSAPSPSVTSSRAHSGQRAWTRSCSLRTFSVS